MDIASWMEAFSIFYLILCSSFPDRWRDLTSYKLLILRTYPQFSGFCWLDYDQAFREHPAQKKSPTGLRCMFTSSTTIQLALKFVLAEPHLVMSRPRQRLLVMLPVKSFAILGTLVIVLQLIHSVSFTMHVAGAGAIIVLLLVLLHSLLLLARRILTSQNVASAINCLALVVPLSNFELN